MTVLVSVAKLININAVEVPKLVKIQQIFNLTDE